MTGSAAGCNEYTHLGSSLLFCLRSARGIQHNGLCLALALPLGVGFLPFQTARSPLRPILTITPISASSRIRLVPPEEKKGSEMPVLAGVLVTTAMLQNTCQAICA